MIRSRARRRTAPPAPPPPALLGELTWAGLGGVCVLVHGRDEVTATLALDPGLGLVRPAGPPLAGWTALLSHLAASSARVDRLTQLIRVASGEPHAFLTVRVRAGREPAEPPALGAALVEDLSRLVLPFLDRVGVGARPLPMSELAALLAHCFRPSRPLGDDVGLTPLSAYPAVVEEAAGCVRADDWWHATAAVRTHPDRLPDEFVAAVAALPTGAVALSDVVRAGDREQDTLTASVTVSAPSPAELDPARLELSGLVAGWGWPRDQSHVFAAAALPFARVARFVGPAVPDPRPAAPPPKPVLPPAAAGTGPADFPDVLAAAPAAVEPPAAQVLRWSAPIADPARPAWFWLGAHGGAGVTTLTRAAADAGAGSGWGLDAERVWPLGAAEPTPLVVVVARTHRSGLLRARAVAGQVRDGAAPEGTVLLGVVLVADAPGGLPPELTEAAADLRDLYPQVWTVPYIEALRLAGGDEPVPADPRLAEVIAAVRVAAQEGHQ